MKICEIEETGVDDMRLYVDNDEMFDDEIMEDHADLDTGEIIDYR